MSDSSYYDYTKTYNLTKIFRMPEDAELTPAILKKFIDKNKQITLSKYSKLQRAYENDYDIFHMPKKKDNKPDNRLAANFAKYITDTMNGFFLGVPIKYDCADDALKERLDFINAYNNIDDLNAELSKLMDMFGRGNELYFIDEKNQLGICYLSPTNSFMIYDDSVREKPLYFVRYYLDAKNIEHGSVSDNSVVRWFTVKGGNLVFSPEEKAHGFADVPATEYVENAERIGLYEGIMSLIDSFNLGLSEKANEIDYFGDAYMKILGTKLDNGDAQFIKNNRIINFEGDSDKIKVDFMNKPSADETQEHHLERLERLIFSMSMVANISDENFGTSSGIALKYKLLAMDNLAQAKQRKFTAGLNRRYKVLFSNLISGIAENDWMKINYKFTRNYPANLSDEADTAGKLAGITSNKTRLSVLSVVNDVDSELEQIEREKDEEAYNTDYPTERSIGFSTGDD